MKSKPRPDSRTVESAESAQWLRAGGDGVLLCLHVQPGARRTAANGVRASRLKLAVQAPAQEGRANDALLDWLTRRLDLRPSKLRIVDGTHSRQKTALVSGIDAEAVRRKLVRE